MDGAALLLQPRSLLCASRLLLILGAFACSNERTAAPPDAPHATMGATQGAAPPEATAAINAGPTAPGTGTAVPAGQPTANRPGSSTPAGTAGSDSQPTAGGSAAPADDAEYLGLAQPERGFRVASRGRLIEPQSDVEYCEISEIPGAPGEEYLVNEIEVANGEGSHHLIVAIAEPDSAADAQIREHAIGEQLPCLGATSEFGLLGTSTFVSTQSQVGKLEYPDGIGTRVHAGQRLVFDYHYFNFGSAPIMAKSAIAVHTLAPDAHVTIANAFAFTNMTIDTPPGSEQTFTAECVFQHDALVGGIARHTHAQGTDFSVWAQGGSKSGELLWSSHDWEHELGTQFDPPLLVKAGEGFKFACGFRNQGDKPLRFGIRSTDEMCILAGMIWSPTPGQEIGLEQCLVTYVDDQGMGHDARDGFPKATAEDALTCTAGVFGLSLIESCLGCMCDSCATIIARCNADSDCKPLLDCTGSCMKGENCNAKCEDVMSAHSSAVGMITQVGECLRSQCGSECAIETPGLPPATKPDAGMP